MDALIGSDLHLCVTLPELKSLLDAKLDCPIAGGGLLGALHAHSVRIGI
jgi:hypothetical protein